MKPTNDEAAEEIRKLIGYLNKNKKRIHYRGDRIGGYPIISGGIYNGTYRKVFNRYKSNCLNAP